MGSLTRPPADGPGPGVLLVEDEPAIRRLFAEAYRDLDLIIVENVNQALQVLKEQQARVGVVLADHYLPDGTGIDVLVWAKEHLPDAVRLLTTSHAHLSQAVAAVNSGGISGYVTKPWALDELRAMLERALQTYVNRRREMELLEGKRATLMSLATSIAHEMRTPLATIRLRAHAMAQHWPMLMDLYREAVASGRMPAPRPGRLESLAKSPFVIEGEVERANMVIEMLLASANVGKTDTGSFAVCRMGDCVRQARDSYPLDAGMEGRILVEDDGDFAFFGSDVLVVFVLYNLMKNALYAVKAVGKGDVTITLRQGTDFNTLVFQDTASGIPPDSLSRIFEDFYTTKSIGTGVGLSFCRQAMRSMGGEITCESAYGEYTRFILAFPVLRTGK